jgi:hypothetical protein
MAIVKQNVSAALFIQVLLSVFAVLDLFHSGWTNEKIDKCKF